MACKVEQNEMALDYDDFRDALKDAIAMVYGVAIWEEPSSEPGMFSVFVTGLSGETTPLTDAEGKEIKDKDGNVIMLRKTLQLDFNVRGDELYAGDPIDKTGEKWVMR